MSEVPAAKPAHAQTYRALIFPPVSRNRGARTKAVHPSHSHVIDARHMQALFHAAAYAGYIVKGQVQERRGHVFGPPDGDPVGLIHLAGNLSEMPISGKTN